MSVNYSSRVFHFWIVIAIIGFVVLLACFVHMNDSAIPDEPEDQLLESVQHPTLWGEPRSSSWPSVRRNFVLSNPDCAACGSNENLNVHHIKPFHENPELELDPSNLITLCRKHHFRIGHDPDGPWKPKKPSWVLSNPNVREDCERWRK